MKPEVAWFAIPGLRGLRLEDPEFEVLWPHSEKTHLKIRDLDLPGLVHQLAPVVFLSPLPSSGVIGVHCDV